jgi:hypothetical protein
MRRQDILQFKRRIRTSALETESERRRLETERDRLIKRLREIDQALANLDGRNKERAQNEEEVETT